MKTKYKFMLVAVPAAIIAFGLSFVIWPNPAGMVGPSASLVPFFIFVSALECLAFGVGIAFLIFGWPMVRRMGGAGGLSTAAFLAVTWSLISWWPHDNMHRVNGMDNYFGLIRIEFMFHVTLIIAGFIVAAYLWRVIKGAENSRAF